MNSRVALFIAMVAASNTQAALPSRAVIYSCLSARPVATSVKWQAFTTTEINSQDDYKDGFDAKYYIISEGVEIGYAEKGDNKAIVYAGRLYPISQAYRLPGFNVRPTELNPYSAEWGMVKDKSGEFLCVSFPFGNLGRSGSFQKNRSAYLLSLGGKREGNIYSAAGNIDMFKTGGKYHNKSKCSN
jgi:hypothetical protein